MKLAITFTILLGLSSISFALNDIEKIIGDNDLVRIQGNAGNIPMRFRSIVDAFGQISVGCTATHIGQGYVLTAGHCFWADEELNENASCEGVTIEWGVRDGVSPYLKSNCETVIAAQRTSYTDFAILKVSPVPPIAIAPELQRRAIPGDTVTIFSHPDSLPLHWSRLCGIEEAAFPEVLSPKNLEHKCDTNPGSSGASILNILTLKIVGIHDGGFISFGKVGINYGTYIQESPLFEILKKLGFK